jgi:hypothetical protein
VDNAGNVYVTGNCANNPQWPYNYDYLTVKYNSAGVEQWTQTYDGPGNDDDYALAIAVDGAGNVYVTGHSIGSGTSDDIATIKYNSAGVEQWVQRYNGPGNDVDCGNAIAVDIAGNIYVTGHTYTATVSDDYITIKYDTDGVEQWVITYNGTGNGGDYSNAIAVDDSANVIITGRSFGGWSPQSMDDYVTIKYNQTTAITENPGTGRISTFGFIPQISIMTQDNIQISYVTTMPGKVILKMYDATGRLVETFVNMHQTAGEKLLTWDNHGVSNGVYFFKLEAENKTAVCKLIMLR